MAIKVGINGFGRIGRMVFRKMINDSDNLEVIAINASYPAETLAHLIQYDTVQGYFDAHIDIEDQAIIVNGKRVQLLDYRDPARLPWKELDVEIVIEATGKFNDRKGAGLHLQGGARKVVLTAPGKQEDLTVVMGVNEHEYNVSRHHIISNASCTTNCLAPLVKVLDKHFGVEHGLMTTVHSYTNDQNNLDNPHKDLRRARACGQSIIPTTTGAANAVSKVLPHLEGKLKGLALRVPTPDVSIVDLVVDVRLPVSVAEVNNILAEESKGSMNGILQYTDKPLVSSDFIGNEHSTIVDGLSTMTVDDRKLKVLAWYDNEWGYSCRVVDLAGLIASSLREDQIVETNIPSNAVVS